MKAEIIAIGSEMLSPTRQDTNSLFITERLNELGIELQAKSVAGDDQAVLRALIAHALERADLLILTGGLGPTDDDVTRNVVAELLKRPLAYHPQIFEAISQRFRARGLGVPEINRRQAMVPDGAAVLENANGTAPGLWLEHGSKLILLLPGPPREMRPMLEAALRDRVSRYVGTSRLFRRVLCITGRTESHVEEAVQPLYARWLAADVPVAATILASPGQIELHLTATASNRESGEQALELAAQEVGAALGLDLFSTRGQDLQEVVGELLRSRGLRIAVAESCTGGLVASRLTDVPGSSDYVERGVVAYSNAAKIQLLNVAENLIAEHGAVSEPVAVAMAIGVARQAGVDLGIGVTGIAGPGGGTPAKPVGTVAVAAVWIRSNLTESRARIFHFLGGRRLVKFQASQASLDLVRRWIIERDTHGPWERRNVGA